MPDTPPEHPRGARTRQPGHARARRRHPQRRAGAGRDRRRNRPRPGAGNGEAPSSLIAGLRAQHRQIGLEKTTTIPLPWWDGKLGVRFRYLDDRGFDRLLEIASGSGSPEMIRRANRDLVIAGCDEVVARADSGEEWGPVIEGERVRFDRTLAERSSSAPPTAPAKYLSALWDDPVRAAMAVGEIAGQYSHVAAGPGAGGRQSLQGESRRPDR